VAEVEVISSLMEAIRFFREQHLSSAYSTMGFTVVAAGWLITSRSARVFIHSHRWLGITGIVMLFASYIGYWRISLGVQAASQGIADQLVSLQVDRSVYGHYILSPQGVHGFIFIKGLALLFLVLIIIAVLRNPGEE
jgi:hypothetical protein